MRWVWRGLAIAALILLLGLHGIHAVSIVQLRGTLDEVRSGQASDNAITAAEMAKIRSELADLRVALDDLDEGTEVEDLRGEAQTAVGRIEEEFAYICSQFTAVECLSFPNAEGR